MGIPNFEKLIDLTALSKPKRYLIIIKFKLGELLTTKAIKGRSLENAW